MKTDSCYSLAKDNNDPKIRDYGDHHGEPMQAELLDIRNHIAQYPPFDEMPEEMLERIVGSIEVAYYRAGTHILELKQQNHWLHYVRSGAVEIYRRSGELYNRVSEGEIFGQFGLLRNQQVRFPAKALEDTLVYKIPFEIFQYLWENDENFADFVEVEDRSRLRTAVSRQAKSNELMTAKVTRLISRQPVCAPATVRLQEAARIMTDHGVSALLLVDDAENQHRLKGIITCLLYTSPSPRD